MTDFSVLEKEAKRLLGLYEEKQAAMLPLLWLVQEKVGHIPPAGEIWVADQIGIGVVHVREVVSFYTMFQTRPVGRQHIQVCASLPCALKGSKQLVRQLEERLGVKAGQTSADGNITLSTVECLCACEQAPVAQVNKTYAGMLEGKELERLVAHVQRRPGDLFEPPAEDRWHVDTDGPVLSKRFGNAGGTDLKTYLTDGGYTAAGKALKMKPEEVIDLVMKSNLRGLGGAGFPTAKKWTFIPKNRTKPVFLVVNADEGEPGTFKDRYILERDPHALIEGMLIAAHAIGAHKAYVYIRGEYFRPYDRLQKAVDEAKAAGWLGKNIQKSGFDLEIILHRGAGAYICGEETALLSSLEGKKGFPKLKPPFPAVEGLFRCPTIVNNVETLACLGPILKNGPEWFAKLGVARQGGTRLFSVSGHVKRPGLYEAPVTVTLRELIESDRYGQGVRDGRKLKAVIPGGISAKVLAADEVDVGMDFDSLTAAGTMAGSAGVIVMDETTSMVAALQSASHFFADESCGQCSPCREGTGWILKMVNRVKAGGGRQGDLDVLLKTAAAMEGKTICVFADAAAWPVQSYITKFRSEFEAALKGSEEALSCRS